MNCKPGDLAIITNANRQNVIGRIVTVVSWTAKDSMGYPGWLLHFENPPAGVNLTHACPDEYLTPITGLPIDEGVSEDLKEPA